ncbi:FG-GAP repeat protein [Rhodocaloribacter litoris]|uniref:FG-GAP repeat protein n=1 Tax=Rhodocaloribacter litoris TaxID=2558931 RepID=UPI001423643A|nr:FG-GAP repeat protein [Rhodocaloribacter litoris]QXD16633.1 FG-GAP repeat protein [Rhodocaloribacter litoris]
MVIPRPCLAYLGLLLMLVAGLPAARAQIFKLPPPDTTAGNFFGVAVALDGDRALVGASGAGSCGENAGAAYLYERDPARNEWRLQARLLPSDCKAGQFFGRAVALSGDRAVVAAFRPFFSTALSNAVYVFEHNPVTGLWEETARLTSNRTEEEGAFAASVALDGDRLLVTAAGDPAGRRYGGAAYLFEREPGGRWKQQARLTGDDDLRYGLFGTDGDLDGDRVVVAASTYFANRPGSIYLFERNPASGAWEKVARFGHIDDFFISVDLSGDRVIVGESRDGPHGSGRATLFERNAEGRWQQTATLAPTQPYKQGGFGTEVALDGDRALVVGYDEQLSFEFNIDRVVYVFAYDPESRSWEQKRILDVGEVAFGSAIDLDGPWALIGQASEQKPGQVYLARLP